MNKFNESKKKYGDKWELGNYLEDALSKNNRSIINPLLYGGNNYTIGQKVLTGVGAGFMLPVTGWVGSNIAGTFLPNAVRRKLNLYNNLMPGFDYEKPNFIQTKDTIIDLTDRPMGYARVNESNYGAVGILGGEYIESANNSVRTAKEWRRAASDDTFGDKNIKTSDIKFFYGVEGDRFKVGDKNDFKDNTLIVPIRYNPRPINKAVLTDDKEMRLLDNYGKPIYHFTQNNGKFILSSPKNGVSKFYFITSGEKGVEEVNKFVEDNPDAIYINMDNGRYEYYGISDEELTPSDFKSYYNLDLERKGNPGYNLTIKK